MTCECKTEIEAKLTEHFQEQKPDASDHGVRLQGYGFAIVDNKMEMLAYMSAVHSANFTLKNGSQKTKSTTTNMFFSYCPFCGVKT